MDRRRHDPMLLAALAAATVLHGGLLLAGSFRRTYDAYVHIFFADHYARDWFSTWESRWYTGFTTSSYPPGSHQVIAALSRLVGLEMAFVIVQLAAVLLLVVGVHRFSRIWVGREAAGWAAIAAVLATSVDRSSRPRDERSRRRSSGGLAQLDLAQRTGETGGLGTWFSGSALERARRAPGGEGATTWSAHQLEAEFYSDDGSILTLTTDARLVRELPDASAWPTRETYRITVLLEDGNWRIRHLERVAVESSNGATTGSATDS